MVDHLGAAPARGVGLEQRPLGGDGREPLVPEGDRQLGQPREVAGEGAGRLRARPFAAVHVARQPEHEPADPPPRRRARAAPRRRRRTSCAGSSAAARRSAAPVSDTATPMVRVPRSSPISARPGGSAAAKAAQVVGDATGHGPSPASRAAASIAASPAGVAGMHRARLGQDRRRLVAPAEHAERADQLRPVLRRAALGGEPLATAGRPCPRSSPAAPPAAASAAASMSAASGPGAGSAGGGRPASRAASASPARAGAIQGASGGPSATSPDQMR